MSKKHYIMVAKSLFESKADFLLCSNLAVQFKNDNRLFDINRFLTACGHQYYEGYCIRLYIIIILLFY